MYVILVLKAHNTDQMQNVDWRIKIEVKMYSC